MNNLLISNIKGVKVRLDENGNPELNLEDVAKGLLPLPRVIRRRTVRLAK